MNDLAVYRDNGPLASFVAGRIGSHRTGRQAARLGWLVPPLLRALEYGVLIALTLVFDPDALAACFALLSALAFHHYDIVYRLRHQRARPPRWVEYVGGGWELRLLIAGLLAAVGWLEVGMLVAAIALGAVYVAESVNSWRRFTQPATLYEDEEDEDE